MYRWASSARTTIAAAAPSATPAQSNTERSPATRGMARSCSTLISLRNWASGFLAPLAWFFDAMRASTRLSSSRSTPYFWAYAGTTIENIAAAVRVRAVPSLGIG